MKRLIKKAPIIIGIMAIVMVAISFDAYRASAKGAITSLPEHWYICENYKKGCKVKVTNTRLIMKSMVLTREREFEIFRSGNFNLKLSNRVKFISGYSDKKISKKKAMKMLNKSSSAIYSFYINKSHKVSEICIADW